jgi:hypothetical protein
MSHFLRRYLHCSATNWCFTVTNGTVPGRSIRLYAKCARVNASGDFAPHYDPGSVLILAINLDNATSATVDLADAVSGSAIPLFPRDEYRFSGPLPAPLPGSDSSCFFAPGYGPKLPYLPSPLCLNGKLLYLSDGPNGPNTTLPFLHPISVNENTPVVMPPLSVAMFVLKGSNAPACR